jgi:multisubunit Na+/H+ antiporter MnhG subunit
VLLTTLVAAHVIARASYVANVPLWDGTRLDERQGAPPTPADENRPPPSAEHL